MSEENQAHKKASLPGKRSEQEPPYTASSAADSETATERHDSEEVSTKQNADVEKEAGAAPGGEPSSQAVASSGGFTWDGPDDPDNPINWPQWKRVAQILIVAYIILISNLASTMFAPGASQVVVEFHITSSVVGSLLVSIYVLGFALGPLLWGPLSEMYGRLPIYIISATMFTGFMIGTAFSKDLGTFLAMRFLVGSSGGASMAICGGTLADVIEPQHRGKWMGIFVLGPLMGPTIGPIIGGFIAQDVGWRWVFRVLTIAMGLLIFLVPAFMRETYGPVILRQRTIARQKPAVELGSDPALQRDPRKELTQIFVQPLKLLLLSPLVTFMSLYGAFFFGLLFLLFTTFTAIFEGQYGFSASTAGLSYLGLGIGMFVGVLIQGRFSDRIMKQRLIKNGRSKPEDRLPLMAYMAPMTPIGMFWYGWSADQHAHWIVPIIGTFFVGVGMASAMMPTMVYLVDCYGSQGAASALAANTLLRCIAGAFLPLAGPPMYKALGLGWGNSLLGFLAVGLLPIPWIFAIYGERIRLNRKVQP